MTMTFIIFTVIFGLILLGSFIDQDKISKVTRRISIILLGTSIILLVGTIVFPPQKTVELEVVEKEYPLLNGIAVSTPTKYRKKTCLEIVYLDGEKAVVVAIPPKELVVEDPEATRVRVAITTTKTTERWAFLIDVEVKRESTYTLCR